MLEVLSSVFVSQAKPIIRTEPFRIEYRAKYVCAKRKQINYNGITYYIRTCDKTKEEQVNRCTWLANEIGRLYVYEDAKKWCSKEKRLYKSIWIYT